jgi:hypothetical protein
LPLRPDALLFASVNYRAGKNAPLWPIIDRITMTLPFYVREVICRYVLELRLFEAIREW